MQRILFVHQTKHVGGGQSFVNGYKRILENQDIPFDFFENIIEWQMVKNIFQRRYSKAFLHLYSPLYVLLAVLLKLLGVPIVTTVYGVWFLELQSQTPTQFRKRALWLRLAQTILFACCETLIVFSQYEQDLVEQHFPFFKNRMVIIPGGVDLQQFKPVSLATKTRIRKELDLPVKAAIFLVLSRLDRRKGTHLTIEAFSKVLQSHPNSLLCIVFPADKCSQLEILTELFQQTATLNIGQKVHFITGINQQNAPRYFQAADIFVMSSIDLETFGLTTLEALASGCLPIGFRSGATPDILQKIDKKLIVSPISSTALAERLSWGLKLSAQKYQELSKKCRARATDYAWKNIETIVSEKLR